MDWIDERRKCRLIKHDGSDAPSNLIRVWASPPLEGTKDVLLVFPGLDSKKYEARYSMAVKAALGEGMIVAEHVLPGSEKRLNEEFRSYGECIRELKDTYGFLISGTVEACDGGCMAREITIMADGLSARFAVEVIEEYGIGVKRLILIDPLLEDGNAQYPEICGKMNINGRIAERCGRVPVETGKDEVPFVSEDFFHGLETSAPLKGFGNIPAPVFIISADKEASAKLAEKGRDVSVLRAASFEKDSRLTPEEIRRDAENIASAVVKLVKGIPLNAAVKPAPLSEGDRLSAVIGEHLAPQPGRENERMLQ